MNKNASNERIPDEEEEEDMNEFKFNFMKKFATKTGSLSSLELEELLAQKITESIRFRTNIAELCERLERQKAINTSNIKRLNIISKQYQDLKMTHNRLVIDLNDRPDAAIVPVKIMRDVGLQVYQNAAPQHTRPIKNRPAQLQPMSGNPHNSERPKATATTSLSAYIKLIKDRQTQRQQMSGNPLLNSKRQNVLVTKSLSAPKHMRPIKYRPIQPKPLNDNPHNSKRLKATATKSPSALLKLINPHTSERSMQGATSKAGNGSVTIKKSSPTTSNGIALLDVEGGNTTVPQETPPHLALIRGGRNPDPQETRVAVVTKPTIASANSTMVKAPNVVVKYIRTSEANRVVAPHPAPLPLTPSQPQQPGQKKIPPRPIMKVCKSPTGIIVSWKIEQLTEEHEDILTYHIYSYEETTAPPASDNWKLVGGVLPLPFPMAVTLTQFQEGQKFFFSVRAIDIHKRLGEISSPQTWLEKQ